MSFSRYRVLKLILAVVWGTLFMLARPVLANDLQAIETDRWHVEIAVGYGQLDNPRFKSEPIRSVVLPSVSYYGDRFYLDNLTLGYSLFETDNVLVDVQTHVNEDGLLFELKGLGNVLLSDLLGYAPINDPYEQPQYADVERNISVLGGVYTEVPTPWFTASMGAYQDLTDVHNGHEILLKFNRRFAFEHFTTAIEFGWTYKSAELTRYYYEVGPDDIAMDVYGNRLSGGVNSHVRGVVNIPLNASWRVVAILEYNTIDADIAHSPLLDAQHYWGGFFGFSYAF